MSAAVKSKIALQYTGAGPKILVVNHVSAHNKGDEAIMKVMLAGFREVVPRATVTVLSSTPTYDSIILNTRTYGDFWHTPNKYPQMVYALLIIAWAFFKRYTHTSLNRIFSRGTGKILSEFEAADVVVGRGGDFFNDAYDLKSLASQCFVVLVALSLGKRVILMAHSIGPFRRIVFMKIVGMILNKVDLITVRGETSLAWLKTMGVNSPPVYVTADLAFLLASASQNRVDQILYSEGIPVGSKPVVGFSVNRWLQYSIGSESSDAKQGYQDLVSFMSRIVGHLTEKVGAYVIFVPNVFGFPWDDRETARDIFDELQDKNNVHLIEKEYDSEEIRGLISCFDMFIGCRMHSVIASTSVSVPSIAVSYMDKFYDIMGTLDQDSWVVDPKIVGFDGIRSKIDEIWQKREKVRKDLRRKMKNVRMLAWRNFILFKEAIG